MIKMFFKLLKYSLIIYLMICFKNLYSETFSDNSVITVSMPAIIDLSDIEEAQITDNNTSIFAEKMQYYSHENQQKLEQEQKRLAQAQKQIVTAESYRQLLQEGLVTDEGELLRKQDSKKNSNN